MLTQLKRLKSFLINTCVVVPSSLTFAIICYSADNQRAELMELGVFVLMLIPQSKSSKEGAGYLSQAGL